MSNWKPIEYNTLYEVRVDGVVRSHHWSPPKLLKPGVCTGGYLTVCLCKEGKQRTHYIHRLVAENFLANPDRLSDVNHKDGNKQNNALDNLTWCSHRDNQRHAYRTGLMPGPPPQIGEAHHAAKLTNAKVTEIKQKYARGGTSYRKLGSTYGVSKFAIQRIISGDGWKHVQETTNE